MPKRTSRFSHPYIFAILSGSVSSIGAVFCRASLIELPSLWVAAIQFIAAIPILLLFCKRGVILRLWNSPKRAPLFWMGILQGIGSILYTLGSSYTTATNALFLTKVLPYWVLFWEWVLYRKSISKHEFLLLAIHVLGAWILSSGGVLVAPSVGQLGDLFLILAMMVSALSTVLSQDLVQKLPAREMTLSYMTIAGLFTLIIPLCLGTNLPTLGGHEKSYLYLFVNTICFIVLHLFALLALLGGKPWKVTALRALGPLAGLPFAAYIMNEELTSTALIGGSTVLLTSLIMVIERKKDPAIANRNI